MAPVRTMVALLGLSLGLLAPVRAQTREAYFAPWDDCEARAMAVLDRAQRTVDVAQYNIRNAAFFDKLVELEARGVRVRLCVDQKNAVNAWNTLDDRFEAEGFDLVRVRNDRGPNAIMHHKFTVVDGAIVMTGSYNWNETAQEVNDECMLVLSDPALAAAYTAEFEELRGAPQVALPGQGNQTTVYFSPEDDPRAAILDRIRRAQRSVRVAMFTFTDTTIARALRDAARRGVDVLLVVEQKQAVNTTADETVATGGAHARVLVVANTASAYSAMHHKIAVIDDEYVIAGACNWTHTAFTQNEEDLLVIDDRALAARFTQAIGDLLSRHAPQALDPAAFGIDRPEVQAHFTASCPSTQLGETVVLVGGDPVLGDWDPARGIPLETEESLFPTWTARLTLPRGVRIPWKLVIRGPSGDRWEDGDDRVLETSPLGVAGDWQVDFRAPPPAPGNTPPAPTVTPGAPPSN